MEKKFYVCIKVKPLCITPNPEPQALNPKPFLPQSSQSRDARSQRSQSFYIHVNPARRIIFDTQMEKKFYVCIKVKPLCITPNPEHQTLNTKP